MPDSPSSPNPSGAVFLSYASQDAEAARNICEALRSAGVTVWFDQEGGLEHGDEWDAKIRRQIKECVLFLPIISANTQAREEGYFRIEWELATNRAMGIASGVAFILPIVIDDTREPDALVPDRFRKVQWTRLPGGQVPADVKARFLKLWSHRTGVISHQASQAVAAQENLERQAASPSGRRSYRTWWFAALVVAVLTVNFWGPWRKSTPLVPPAAGPLAPAQTATVPAAPVAAEKSVAVLAFANLSEEKDNEYFSDGISEELLNVLQKIPGLHVAARTSAFSFKGKNATVQEIGQKLGVVRLVEGSVHKSGTRVKVSVRLSNVATGEEVWSHSYTRELKDVFALQEELALAIVGELRGQLGGDAPAAQIQTEVATARRGGTRNVEAYQAYLQGRFILAQFTQANFPLGIAAAQRAVDLDPSFAIGWASLAEAKTLMGSFTDGLSQTEYKRIIAEARAAADRALELEPNLPEGLAARADIQQTFDYDWNGAKETMAAVLKLESGNAEFLTTAAKLANSRGDLAGSSALMRQSLALDPLNNSTHAFYAYNLIWEGKLSESREEYKRLIALIPNGPWVHAGLAMSLLLEGKFEEAATAAQPEKADYARLLVISMARWGQGRQQESDAALNELIAKEAEGAAYQIAEAYAYRGQNDLAFQWLNRAREQRDAGMSNLLTDTTLAKLHSDPRWPVLLRSVNLAPEQLK